MSAQRRVEALAIDWADGKIGSFGCAAHCDAFDEDCEDCEAVDDALWSLREVKDGESMDPDSTVRQVANMLGEFLNSNLYVYGCGVHRDSATNSCAKCTAFDDAFTELAQAMWRRAGEM